VSPQSGRTALDRQLTGNVSGNRIVPSTSIVLGAGAFQSWTTANSTRPAVEHLQQVPVFEGDGNKNELDLWLAVLLEMLVELLQVFVMLAVQSARYQGSSEIFSERF
jgi:hypothetical protein